MNNEFRLNRDNVRGAQAQALLDNDILKEAFSALEAGYIKAWRECGPHDLMAREKLWLAVNQIGKVRDHLHRVISDGKLAQREIEQLTEKRKRLA